MSEKNLQFCKPFYTIKSVKDEAQYRIDCKSIVLNLGEKDIIVKDKPLVSLQSTVVTNITIKNIQWALVVENYEKNSEEELLTAVKKQWPLMYEITHVDRYKRIPVRRSPKEKIENVELNLFYVGDQTSIGIHKEHDYREVHTQLLGFGKMQKFEENDYSKLYQEEILAPGFTHEPYCNKDGKYPWHQYQSITESIYIYVNKYE